MPLFHYFKDKYPVYTTALSRLYSLYCLKFSSFCQFSVKRLGRPFFWPIVSGFCLVMSVATRLMAPFCVVVGFSIVVLAMQAALRGGGTPFLPGFLWGMIWSGGVLLFPFFPLVKIVGVYPCGLALFGCVLVLSLYGGFLGGAFLYLWVKLCEVLKQRRAWVVFGEMGLLLLFFRFLLYDTLRVFDLGEGFFFLHPLAPLMESPVWRELVVLGGEWGALGLFVASLFGIRFFVEKKRYALCLFFVFILSIPWVWNAPSSQLFSQEKKAFCCLPSKAFSPCNALSSADAARLFACSLPKEVLNDQVLVFPESAFPVEVAQGTKAFQALESMSFGRRLLCGCYWRGEKGVSNAAVYFCNGICKGVYCKRHGVPFVERLPLWCNWECVRRWLQPLIGDELFVQGCVPAPEFECGTSCLVPLLCSELFSGPISLPCTSKNSIIVGMVNDAWWQGSLFPYHLWRVAALRVLAARLPFLYVSYEQQGFFDGRGGWLKL